MTEQDDGISAAIKRLGPTWKAAAERFHERGGFANEGTRLEWAGAWLRAAPRDPQHVGYSPDFWALALMGELSSLDPIGAWNQLEYLRSQPEYTPAFDYLLVGQLDSLVRHHGMAALAPALAYARTEPLFVASLRDLRWQELEAPLIEALHSLPNWTLSPDQRAK